MKKEKKIPEDIAEDVLKAQSQAQRVNRPKLKIYDYKEKSTISKSKKRSIDEIIDEKVIIFN